jgi:hypothetical protein
VAARMTLTLQVLSICVVLAGTGHKRQRHFLEPEAYKAVVVPVVKQLDTNKRWRTKNAGCAAKDGIADNTIELISPA